MTVAHFERLVAAAPGFQVDYLRPRAVKGLPIVSSVPVLRELMTGAMTCILHRRSTG